MPRSLRLLLDFAHPQMRLASEAAISLFPKLRSAIAATITVLGAVGCGIDVTSPEPLSHVITFRALTGMEYPSRVYMAQAIKARQGCRWEGSTKVERPSVDAVARVGWVRVSAMDTVTCELTLAEGFWDIDHVPLKYRAPTSKESSTSAHSLNTDSYYQENGGTETCTESSNTPEGTCPNDLSGRWADWPAPRLSHASVRPSSPPSVAIVNCSIIDGEQTGDSYAYQHEIVEDPVNFDVTADKVDLWWAWNANCVTQVSAMHRGEWLSASGWHLGSWGSEPIIFEPFSKTWARFGGKSFYWNSSWPTCGGHTVYSNHAMNRIRGYMGGGLEFFWSVYITGHMPNCGGWLAYSVQRYPTF